METFVIALIAALASLLTFFSGFGLGTILLPVCLLFFPVEIAITLTAIVHFLNGVFKFGLMRGHIDRSVALHFGIPALLLAFAGASLLVYLTEFPIYVQYKLGSLSLSTSPVKVVIGILLLIFSIVEIVPSGKKAPRSGKLWLWLGGALSGFFGGLSGHQGALRSVFLIRLGLAKERFIATGIMIALLIDITRLPVYLKEFDFKSIVQTWPVILAATLGAFAGAYWGSRLLKKVTLRFVQYLVAVAVAVVGIMLALGVV